MIENYAKILPFYDSVSKQFHRREYRMDDHYTFHWIAPHNLLLPFQLQRQNRPDTITEFALYDINDVVQYDLLTYVVSGQTNLKTVTNNGVPADIFTYFANKPLTSDIDCGQYYYKVSDGIDTWYSEVITVEAFDGEYDSADIINGTDLDIEIQTPLDIIRKK